MDERSESNGDQVLAAPCLANTEDLPCSPIFLQFMHDYMFERPMRQRFMSIPLHSLTPDALTNDINYYRQISIFSKQIQAADRRSSFYGRAIHAITANDSREAARLFTDLPFRVQQAQILASDYYLREMHQDRYLPNNDAKLSVIYSLQYFSFKLQEVCPCPGCFYVYEDDAKLYTHISRHMSKTPVFRCHICATTAFYKTSELTAELTEKLDYAYFNTAIAFFTHLETHKFVFKGQVLGSFYCPICLKGFSSEQEALAHVKLHSEQAFDFEALGKNMICKY